MVDRREFLQLAAASATIAATGAVPAPAIWQPPLTPVLMANQWEMGAVLRLLDKPADHKQIFLSNPSMLTSPGVAGVFQKMSLAWTCYEFSLGKRRALSMAGILIANPVVFALNDAMWKKYGIAQAFKLSNRSGRIESHNFSHAAWSSLNMAVGPNDTSGIYHDFTSQALSARGASFFVCHNALSGVSAAFAASSGISHAHVLQEWTQNLLPGFLVVPSGAMLVQLAHDAGWKLYPITD